MKRICKQCGKEFALTQLEINFYKSKNLAIPKRCQECRAENKAQKQAGETASYEETEANPAEKTAETATATEAERATAQGVKVSYSAAESNIQVKQPVESGSAYIAEEGPVSQSRPEIYKPQREIPEIGKKWWVAVAAVLLIAVMIIFPNLTKKSGSAGVFETKGYTDGTEGESINSSESADENKSTDSTVEDKQNITVKVRFHNNTLLQQHYDKHGKEMGFASAVEYEMAAAAVVSNPKALHKTEAEDGDDVYYIEQTNEFVIVSTDGYIRTYFNPSDGINYYNRQ